MQQALLPLTRCKANVLMLHFALNGHAAQTLEEVGEQFSITHEWARQIKEKANRRLKHTSRPRALRLSPFINFALRRPA
jgi:RNA polymerase primary sigma factor